MIKLLKIGDINQFDLNEKCLILNVDSNIDDDVGGIFGVSKKIYYSYTNTSSLGDRLVQERSIMDWRSYDKQIKSFPSN